MPTIVIVHMFRASRDTLTGFPIGDAYKYSYIFARFKTIHRK